MLKTRVIPCLLIKDRRLVKTVRFKNPAYIGDPVNAIKIYNEKEVDELIVADIAASAEGRQPPFALLSEIASECFMPLTYGGGIRTVEDARRIFSLGIEKIVVNTHAVENPPFIKQLADLFGSQSVVVALDVKKNLWGKYVLGTCGGRKMTSLNPVEFAKKSQDLGAGEIFLNSIDRDGTWEGYDINLIRRVSGAVSIPLIACGGAGKAEDFATATKEGGASAVAAGSMVVYQGKDLGVLINFPDRETLTRLLD